MNRGAACLVMAVIRVLRAAQRAHRSYSTAARVVLLDATEAAGLESSTARQLIVRVPSTMGDDTVRLLDIFVIRAADGSFRAFENHCPHAGGALNMLPDRFFTRDGGALLCTRHGARFSPEDGLCFHGPCAGDALNVLDTSVSPSGEVETTKAALVSLCDHGGGAFILRDQDDPEAQGPLVQRPQPLPPQRARRRHPSGTE